jgi:hypothetical protein
VNPQQENTSPSTNLLSQSSSKVENLMEVEGLKKQDSERGSYVDGGIKKEYKLEAEKVEAETVEVEKVDPEKVASNSQSKSKGKVSKFYFV